jgi:hypothetical protein
MLPTGETTSPRSKFPDQLPSNQSVVPTFAWLPYWSAYPNGTSSTRLFSEIAVPAHNTFKEVQPCKIDAPFDLIGGCGTANLTQCVVSLARNTRPSDPADWPRFAITSCKNRHDGTKSDCVTIFQRSISDKIAIDLCPVR